MTVDTLGLSYLKRTLNSKVYDVAIETPLDEAPLLSARMGNRIRLKREDMQAVFSFKLRGAYNKMAHLSEAQLARGVIAASAGNHAQGVAMAASRLNTKATIVMPVTTPSVKINAVKRFGGASVDVVLHGESYSDAAQHAQTLAQEQSWVFVHPFDDPDVIAGQATVGMEIVRQHTGSLDAIFVAIGGGGLAAGVAAFIKQLRPEVRVFGVQTVDSDAMAKSLEAGEVITLSEVGLFSDGTAVKQVGTETFKLCQQYLDGVIRVSTDEVCAAIKDVFEETRSILEPAGALAVAGLKQHLQSTGITNANFIAIACGANMNFDRLRFVAERAEVGEYREALLGIRIPEARGSFRQLCSLLGPVNVTEFNYRMSDPTVANLLVGLQVHNVHQTSQLIESLNQQGFHSINLSHDELAKLHLRHMIGGRAPGEQSSKITELLYRFEFPERPGALARFLNAMNPNWNISLFQYRNQGADYGRILVGVQVPPEQHEDFAVFAQGLGYPHWNESQHAAYQMFLK